MAVKEVCKETEDDYDNAKYFKDNLFFKIQTLIERLDEIISQSKKKEDEKKVINISEFDKTYEAVYLELKTIVEETETQNNIDAFNQFHQTFLDTLEQVKKSAIN